MTSLFFRTTASFLLASSYNSEKWNFIMAPGIVSIPCNTSEICPEIARFEHFIELKLPPWECMKVQ